MSAIPSHIKRKLLDAVREEHAVLCLLAPLTVTDVDWSAGSCELWELWRRELVEIVAPPQRPNATNYREARDTLDLFHRAVEGLPDPDSEPPEADAMPTIWYHGERSYSRDRKTTECVTRDQHKVLQAFLDKDISLDTQSLKKHKDHAVSNPSATVKQLLDLFGPECVCQPRREGKGKGYHIRVRSLPQN